MVSIRNVHVYACCVALMAEILIAIGANQPSARANLASVIPSSLAVLQQEYPFSILQVSRIFSTPAWPPGSGDDFVNAAAKIATDLPVQDIMPILHRVEAEFGRTRDVRWGPRVLDLDLTFYGDQVFPDLETVQGWMNKTPENGVISAPDQLIVPHPRMHERAFVVVPAHDVAPDFVHPILGKKICTILQELPPEDVANVRPIA